MGLRELKKERTRKLISDVARDLFLEKGYEAVTIAEIAAQAEVAVQTLFNYFPTKESLIFDLEDEIEADIIKAVRERKKGQSILDSVHHYFQSSKLFIIPDKKISGVFLKMIKTTPELSSYWRSLWARYENALAKEIIKESKADKLEAEYLSKMIFEGVSSACYSAHPKDALNMTFKILKKGWDK